MRPGRILVFDGLRLTTEHLDHLQGAQHSAIYDLRQMAGLGRVHRGFEVSVEPDGTVLLQPGLAFDHEGNRLVSDEPKSGQLLSESSAAEQFVCLKYEQVEGGQVEGHPTLIWDSCSVEIRAEPPEPRDNVVVAARLSRTDAGAFDVLPPTPPAAEPPTDGDGVPSDSEPEPSDTSPAARLLVAQGVTRIELAMGTSDGAPGSLVEQLRAAITTDTTPGDVLIPLREEAMTLAFAPASLSCLTLLSVTCQVTPPEPADASGATGATTAIPAIRIEAQSQGEATLNGRDVVQHGLTTLRAQSSTGACLGVASAITDQAVAEWSVPTLYQPTIDGADTNWSPLEHVRLRIRVTSANANGFAIGCSMVWTGQQDTEAAQQLAASHIHITGTATVAWKAVGMG